MSATASPHGPLTRRSIAGLLSAMLAGALLIALAYQVPTTHTVDLGGYDAAYVQGFFDPVDSAASDAAGYLDGSDGSARWTRSAAYLLFPQAGLPAELRLRARGRPGASPTEVALMYNGQLLGSFQAGEQWQEHRFVLAGGLLKPEDVLIELRAPVASLEGDGPAVGVLIDRAVYTVAGPPVLPYPSQALYGALAAALLYALLALPAPGPGSGKLPSRPFVFVAGLLLLVAAFLLLYRLQLPYPYPLRGLLPAIDALLAALLLLRYGPALVTGRPALLDAAAVGAIVAWAAAVMLAARQHVALSLPGVENDFRVFALRSARLIGTWPAGTRDASLDGVLRADGFYNLGYPLLLWLVRPLTNDNPFLAARLVAALSGALLLLAVWLLARRVVGRGLALLALLISALSPLVVAYALYAGTDMPFAALSTLALALLVGALGHEQRPPRAVLVALAGVLAGAAYLMRHPGLLLLPIGVLGLLLRPDRRAMSLAIYVVAFAIAIAPQLVVNTVHTGQPFFNQQAKNIWLSVYADGDWQRWDEVSNDVALSAVALRDPARFVTHWLANIRAYIGTGAEDTSEFGRAIQLRLLGFPANWLALAGLAGWLLAVLRRVAPTSVVLLLGWVVLYVAGVTVGLALPRFFLPLAPIYALAAAWAVGQIARADQRAGAWWAGRAPLLVSLLLVALLWGGFAIGSAYVLTRQPADAVAAIELVEATIAPGEQLAVAAPARDPIGKYSAIAHLVAPVAAPGDPAALGDAGVEYLLWSEAHGPAPEVGPLVGRAGAYALYQVR